MTDFASWPIITLPTASMCARQWASASMLAPMAMSSMSRSCERMPRWRTAQRVAARLRLADRGDGAGDDLVEHLGDDAQRLVAGEADQALVEAGVGVPERLGVVDDRALLLDQRPELVDRLASRRRREDAHRGRLDHAAGLVHVAEGDVARLEHATRRCGRSCVSLGSWTITPPSTPRTTVISPSASRMRSASRSDGRDTPKRSTRSGSRPSESPSVELAAHDQGAQLVGDLLGLLARSCGLAPSPRRLRVRLRAERSRRRPWPPCVETL